MSKHRLRPGAIPMSTVSNDHPPTVSCTQLTQSIVSVTVSDDDQPTVSCIDQPTEQQTMLLRFKRPLCQRLVIKNASLLQV